MYFIYVYENFWDFSKYYLEKGLGNATLHFLQKVYKLQ